MGPVMQIICQRHMVAAFAAGGLLAVIFDLPSYGASQHLISQKGQAFSPAEIAIQRGEKLRILNDDGDLRHHAYIDSEKLSFDSGDQEPGSQTEIAFPSLGDFTVLCAIHPKMKLVVHVRK